MEKVLIYIKHHLRLIWILIEHSNSILFGFLFKNKAEKKLQIALSKFQQSGFFYRQLNRNDLKKLHQLLNNQPVNDVAYFHPHDFDLKSINKQYNITSFLMMGTFKGDELVGYFFLRFFVNRKCFVGRIIDQNFRGKGIGENMNKIMYNTVWELGFRCLSTISKNNKAVMKAHSKNESMIVLRNLQNDYMLVEFKKINAN